MTKLILSAHQLRVLTKLKQAKEEGIKLALTGADKRTAESLVRKGLLQNMMMQYGIISPIHFEVI